MTLKNLKKLFRFKKSEEGSLTVEFVIIFPLFLFLILSAVEYSLVTIKQAMLERAVDITVRDIRLSTGETMTHDSIKDAICANATIIDDCSNNLLLEMIEQSAYTGVNLPIEPTCVDRSEEVQPVTTFENGPPNALMILRACAKVDPIFPSSNMGRALVGDDELIALTATTAFVQEP
ncbi:TadE/TadG family type IV pilus assembly protein [Ruegeria atlantica]|uniref:TadE/TadG family type IV pilus assembly protein n=1 Tax=Ruegeria atlantica TaxID=81569 RepID=UPI00147B42D9|nr:TadE family protein [Ruegeria atlantica]